MVNMKNGLIGEKNVLKRYENDEKSKIKDNNKNLYSLFINNDKLIMYKIIINGKIDGIIGNNECIVEIKNR
jgi:uncharacterized protein YeeX (DUF496 family)